MPQQTVSVELPEDLPPLEEDLPSEVSAELGPMALLTAEELRRISRESLDRDRQERLEWLAERQKKQTLSDDERAELDELVLQAQRVMLHRAEARRLLVRRLVGAGWHPPQ